LYFFFLGQRKNAWWWLASSACFALAFYAYEVARLFVPLFLLTIVIIYFKELRKKPYVFISALVVFLLLSLPAVYVSLTAQGTARFESISIFREGQSPWQVVTAFISNYVQHLSPKFLFLRGDELPRHGVYSFGELYHFEAPFLILGLLTLFLRRKKLDCLLLAWFFLFPVSSSLTRIGIPHALRTIVALPMPSIITVIGVATLFGWIERARRSRDENQAKATTTSNQLKRILIIVLCLAVAFSAVAFAVDLFIYYPCYSALWWDYGVKQAVEYIEVIKRPQTQVFVSGYLTSKVYLLLFFKHVDPRDLRNRGVRALDCDFLPMDFPIDPMWDLFSSDSVLMLYPGEKISQTPIFMIATPTTATDEQPYPAFYIYRKE
jgi:hypothetical protein